MKFMSSAEEIHWRELKKEVELMISNIQWGYLTIDYSKFGEEGKKLSQELYDNIKSFQQDDFCYDDEEDYKPKDVLWLFDFFTKARCFGALIGVLQDKTYEDKIEELESRIETLQNDNERLRNENLILANELHDRQNIIESYEQGAAYKRGDDDDREK